MKKVLALAALALGLVMATAPQTEVPMPENCGAAYCNN